MIEVQVIENARRAEREGYDAVAIACFHDPGLHVARSVVDIPVLGMCETSLVTSMAYGGKFALLCLHRPIVPFLQGLVESYGFGPRVVAIETIEPSVSGLELEAVYDDPTLLHTRVKEAADRAAAAGADVLIPAENILNTLFVHHQISELAGMPVIDTYGALLAHSEMLVRLRQRRGLQVSRRNTYLRPRDDMLDAMRHASGRALAADS
jgi:allantoin racemase